MSQVQDLLRLADAREVTKPDPAVLIQRLHRCYRLVDPASFVGTCPTCSRDMPRYLGARAFFCVACANPSAGFCVGCMSPMNGGVHSCPVPLDDATIELIADGGVMPCPGCRQAVQKLDRAHCDRMHCDGCRLAYCGRCGASPMDYDHFATSCPFGTNMYRGDPALVGQQRALIVQTLLAYSEAANGAGNRVGFMLADD
jgi:hypothetical protein